MNLDYSTHGYCDICGKPYIYIGDVPLGGFPIGQEPYCTCGTEICKHCGQRYVPITSIQKQSQYKDYIGKNVKIYYNEVGVDWGTVVRYDTRFFPNDTIVIHNRNALNQDIEVHYLLNTIDKIED